MIGKIGQLVKNTAKEAAEQAAKTATAGIVDLGKSDIKPIADEVKECVTRLHKLANDLGKIGLTPNQLSNIWKELQESKGKQNRIEMKLDLILDKLEGGE